MTRTGIALLLNWLACSTAVALLGKADLWAWFTAIDTLTAVAITVRPAARMQAIVGAVLLAQIVLHAIYGVSILIKNTPNMEQYLDTLDGLAALNLLLFTTWVGGRLVWIGLVRAVGGSLFRPADTVAGTSRVAGVE